jgi:hypothetical protein
VDSVRILKRERKALLRRFSGFERNQKRFEVSGQSYVRRNESGKARRPLRLTLQVRSLHNIPQRRPHVCYIWSKEKNTMTVQTVINPVTAQDHSLKIEVLKGTKWEDAGDWRFPLDRYNESNPADLCDAKLYARDLTTKQGVIGPLQVIPSKDSPNCHLVGGIGQRHLEYTDR